MTGGAGNAALIAVIAIVPLVVLMLTSFATGDAGCCADEGSR